MVEALILVAILALAAILRLANGTDNPGWYSDEGTLLNIAHNLLQGRVQYLSINQSTLLAARLPLFPWLLAGLSRIFGEGIGTLRAFTGMLGVVSVAGLYMLTRRALGKKGRSMALMAALMLAIYPQAVLYSRLGFSYNLLTPLVLLTGLGLWEYLQSRRPAWLAVAALSIGIGSVSDLMIFTLVLPLGLVISTRRWQDAVWAIPLALLPWSVYAAVMLAQAPEAFLFDLRFTFGRLAGIPQYAQLPLVALNLSTLMTWDPWMGPAMVGIFLLRPARWRRLILLICMLPLFTLGRTAGLAGLGFYYISPLLPFVALGMAALVYYGAPVVLETLHNGLVYLLRSWGLRPERRLDRWIQARAVAAGTSLGLFLFVVTPFLIPAILRLQGSTLTPIDGVLVDASDARQVAGWVNSASEPQDTVIASPALAWTLETQTTDFQLALAAEGVKTEHFPANIAPDRFAFDGRIEQARFVVIDRIWRNWGVRAMPELAATIQEVERWPEVLRVGEFAVYRNPTR